MREGTHAGKHSLHWIEADLMLADIGTKNLDAPSLQPRLGSVLVTVPDQMPSVSRGVSDHKSPVSLGIRSSAILAQN